MGKLLVLAGAMLVLVGLVVWFAESQNWIRLGRLPGDIRIQRDNVSFFFPLTTCLLISLILSLILFFFRK